MQLKLFTCAVLAAGAIGLTPAQAQQFTMRLSSPTVNDAPHEWMKQFKAGDRVWILWSGIHDYSDAVRQLRRPGSAGKIDEDLVLPAELVSTEAPNQYVTIRVKIPESSVSAIKSVKPGEWVTVTSRHRPATDAEAVVAVRPFGSTAATTTE